MPNVRTPNLRPAGTLTVLALLVAGAAAAPSAQAQAPSGFYVVTIAQGLLGCAAGALIVATDNVCPSKITGDRSSFEFDVPEGADLAIVELQWVRVSTLGARNLALTAPAALGDDDLERTEGPSILRKEIPAADEGGSPATEMGITIGASHDPNLVLEQRFQLAVTLFVDVEPPAGYSAFA